MHVVPKGAPDLPFSITEKFSTEYRLLRNDGFGHVIHAQSLEDKYFKIFFVRNSLKNARLGIIVRKKILSGATNRNHLKRVIRESFRRHDVKTNKLDIVVMVRRGYIHVNGIQSDCLNTLFSRIKNRCEK